MCVFNAMESVHIDALVQLRTERKKRGRERERERERERKKRGVGELSKEQSKREW